MAVTIDTTVTPPVTLTVTALPEQKLSFLEQHFSGPYNEVFHTVLSHNFNPDILKIKSVPAGVAISDSNGNMIQARHPAPIEHTGSIGEDGKIIHYQTHFPGTPLDGTGFKCAGKPVQINWMGSPSNRDIARHNRNLVYRFVDNGYTDSDRKQHPWTDLAPGTHVLPAGTPNPLAEICAKVAK